MTVSTVFLPQSLSLSQLSESHTLVGTHLLYARHACVGAPKCMCTTTMNPAPSTQHRLRVLPLTQSNHKRKRVPFSLNCGSTAQDRGSVALAQPALSVLPPCICSFCLTQGPSMSPDWLESVKPAIGFPSILHPQQEGAEPAPSPLYRLVWLPTPPCTLDSFPPSSTATL